ncbi:unnamed protein product [Rotaria sordida]|uniref:Uncharacterized protein n=2 Tax=Rotaria sordida TaxID=392033 RepID=A0A815HWX5_9BILA|nr:unnamed protein product [Rotaria sordida]CAF1359588.1 unnamed protein product [Rotaria sordida]
MNDLQVIGGAILCFYGHVKFGTSIIGQGLVDVFTAVATKITDDFSMSDYFKNKIVSYGTQLFGLGMLDRFVTPLMSTQTINIIGFGVKTVHELATNGINLDFLKNAALGALQVAGINGDSWKYAKTIVKNIDTATALISGDFKQIMNVKIVNNFLQLFDGENALLKGKEKEILSRALNFSVDLSNFDKNNPLSTNALPKALEEEYTKRNKDINQLIHTTIDLINSSGHLTTDDAVRVVTEIFHATDPSSIYEANKHRSNVGVRSIVEPCIQQCKHFQDQIKFFENQFAVQNCFDMLRQQNISYETLMTSNGSNLMKNIIGQQLQSNNMQADILKTVLFNSVDKLVNPIGQTRGIDVINSDAGKLLKNHIEMNIIRPYLDIQQEKDLNKADQKLMNQFSTAFEYLQRQRVNGHRQ